MRYEEIRTDEGTDERVDLVIYEYDDDGEFTGSIGYDLAQVEFDKKYSRIILANLPPGDPT